MYEIPTWLSGKESTCSAGDVGFDPGWGRSSGEEVATYSSILAWETPWTEEPGGLQSMRSQTWTQLNAPTVTQTQPCTVFISPGCCSEYAKNISTFNLVNAYQENNMTFEIIWLIIT